MRKGSRLFEHEDPASEQLHREAIETTAKKAQRLLQTSDFAQHTEDSRNPTSDFANILNVIRQSNTSISSDQKPRASSPELPADDSIRRKHPGSIDDAEGPPTRSRRKEVVTKDRGKKMKTQDNNGGTAQLKRVTKTSAGTKGQKPAGEVITKHVSAIDHPNLMQNQDTASSPKNGRNRGAEPRTLMVASSSDHDSERNGAQETALRSLRSSSRKVGFEPAKGLNALRKGKNSRVVEELSDQPSTEEALGREGTVEQDSVHLSTDVYRNPPRRSTLQVVVPTRVHTPRLERSGIPQNPDQEELQAENINHDHPEYLLEPPVQSSEGRDDVESPDEDIVGSGSEADGENHSPQNQHTGSKNNTRLEGPRKPESMSQERLVGGGEDEESDSSIEQLELFDRSDPWKRVLKTRRDIQEICESTEVVKTKTTGRIIQYAKTAKRYYNRLASEREGDRGHHSEVERALESICDKLEIEAIRLREKNAESTKQKANIRGDLYLRVIPALIDVVNLAFKVRGAEYVREQDIIYLSEVTKLLGTLSNICEKADKWNTKPNCDTPMIQKVKRGIVSPVRQLRKVFEEVLQARYYTFQSEKNRIAVEQSRKERDEKLQQIRESNRIEAAKKQRLIAESLGMYSDRNVKISRAICSTSYDHNPTVAQQQTTSNRKWTDEENVQLLYGLKKWKDKPSEPPTSMLGRSSKIANKNLSQRALYRMLNYPRIAGNAAGAYKGKGCSDETLPCRYLPGKKGK